ncbi:MAG TPA: Holliday junction branch migration protein RuvA [Bacteroidia bacterium]|jgi:Holliday junction DNA helicase RuvA
MIHHLEGRLVEKTPTYAVIDCGGVGYLLYISLNTYTRIGESEKCKLFVEQLYVRDDLPRSFGFSDYGERELFRKLVSVSGVGGTTALIMLSSLTAVEIQNAIATANVALLRSIKGIGEKTAQRIIVDLKGKLGEGAAVPNFLAAHNKTKEEALIALVNLGFAKQVAEKAIEKVIKSDPTEKTVEVLIKDALKNL